MVPDIRGLMVGVRVFLPITLELGAAATWESLKNVFVTIEIKFVEIAKIHCSNCKQYFTDYSGAGSGRIMGKP